jgi:hypothetical protein
LSHTSSRVVTQLIRHSPVSVSRQAPCLQWIGVARVSRCVMSTAVASIWDADGVETRDTAIPRYLATMSTRASLLHRIPSGNQSLAVSVQSHNYRHLGIQRPSHSRIHGYECPIIPMTTRDMGDSSAHGAQGRTDRTVDFRASHADEMNANCTARERDTIGRPIHHHRDSFVPCMRGLPLA